VLAATSLLGTGVCLLRPSHADTQAAGAKAESDGIEPWEEAVVEEAMLPGLDGSADTSPLGVR
jgi:hypothetical protein